MGTNCSYFRDIMILSKSEMIKTSPFHIYPYTRYRPFEGGNFNKDIIAQRTQFQRIVRLMPCNSCTRTFRLVLAAVLTNVNARHSAHLLSAVAIGCHLWNWWDCISHNVYGHNVYIKYFLKTVRPLPRFGSFLFATWQDRVMVIR